MYAPDFQMDPTRSRQLPVDPANPASQSQSNPVKVNQSKSKFRFAPPLRVWRLEFSSSLELGAWTLGASLSALEEFPQNGRMDPGPNANPKPTQKFKPI
jgi:hypothetical protein